MKNFIIGFLVGIITLSILYANESEYIGKLYTAASEL